MKNSRNATLILISVVLIATNSCAFSKGKEIAEKAAVRFHEQFNAGQYREIYRQTDDEFQKSATEADFVALLEAVQRKLGNVKDASAMAWNVNVTPDGTFARVAYEVEFKEGKGQEQFVFRVRDDRALLYGYNVNSPLLITR